MFAWTTETWVMCKVVNSSLSITHSLTVCTLTLIFRWTKTGSYAERMCILSLWEARRRFKDWIHISIDTVTDRSADAAGEKGHPASLVRQSTDPAWDDWGEGERENSHETSVKRGRAEWGKQSRCQLWNETIKTIDSCIHLDLFLYVYHIPHYYI